MSEIVNEFEDKWGKFWKAAIVFIGIMAAIATAMASITWGSLTPEEAVSRAANVPCYTEQGGAKTILGSGCELEAQSGSTVDFQGGSTINISGTTTLTGTTISGGTITGTILGDPTYSGDPTFSGNPTFSSMPTFSDGFTAAGITSTAGITITNGNLTIADNLIVTAQTAISPTDGGIITATGTYQPLSSAGSVTVTIATAGVTTGTHLILENTTATSILILNTGTAKLAGDATLGQYDSIHLRFDGTNWIEISRSDNTPTAGLLVSQATYAIEAEGNNLITVTVQLKDVDADDLTVPASVPFYLTSDAAGLDPQAAPDAGIAVLTDGALIEWTANASGLAISEADGDLDIVFGDSGSGTWYLVLVMSNGSLSISGAITFS